MVKLLCLTYKDVEISIDMQQPFDLSCERSVLVTEVGCCEVAVKEATIANIWKLRTSG
jgi:hypothetical protein